MLKLLDGLLVVKLVPITASVATAGACHLSCMQAAIKQRPAHAKAEHIFLMLKRRLTTALPIISRITHC